MIQTERLTEDEVVLVMALHCICRAPRIPAPISICSSAFSKTVTVWMTAYGSVLPLKWTLMKVSFAVINLSFSSTKGIKWSQGAADPPAYEVFSSCTTAWNGISLTTSVAHRYIFVFLGCCYITLLQINVWLLHWLLRPCSCPAKLCLRND